MVSCEVPKLQMFPILGRPCRLLITFCRRQIHFRDRVLVMGSHTALRWAPTTTMTLLIRAIPRFF